MPFFFTFELAGLITPRYIADGLEKLQHSPENERFQSNLQVQSLEKLQHSPENERFR